MAGWLRRVSCENLSRGKEARNGSDRSEGETGFARRASSCWATSGAVITKRCYGVKSSDTLWNRLILDLNRASEAVGRGIDELREIVSGLKAVFLGFCT